MAWSSLIDHTIVKWPRPQHQLKRPIEKLNESGHPSYRIVIPAAVVSHVFTILLKNGWGWDWVRKFEKPHNMPGWPQMSGWSWSAIAHRTIFKWPVGRSMSVLYFQTLLYCLWTNSANCKNTPIIIMLITNSSSLSPRPSSPMSSPSSPSSSWWLWSFSLVCS